MGLTQWFNNQNHIWDDDSPIFSHNIKEDDAFKSQLQVGWYYFLCGMITTDIVKLQQAHYIKIETTKLGSRWAITFTQKLWQVLHKLWKHRCNTLFQNNKVDNLSGLPQLMTAISK